MEPDHDPIHVVSVARARFVGMEFERHAGSWLGDDIIIDGESVIVQFHLAGHDEILGVRLQLPVLPLEGMSYRGVRMQTADDWLSDVVITLQEAAATGVLGRSDRTPHDDWTEVRLSFDPWAMEPSTGLTDWP